MKMKHLTLEDRKQIPSGVEEGLSKAAIAHTIGKDPTTVAKEITRHRALTPATISTILYCVQNSRNAHVPDVPVPNIVLLMSSSPVS